MGGWDAPWHWVVLAIIVIALFGYKKLPDAARAVGRSLRIFKTEIKGMTEDDKARKAKQDAEPAEPKALPPAEVVRRDVSAGNGAGGNSVAPNGAAASGVQRPRPRPAPRA
jgi:sec-independent protein translocase protein TatA